ncbi:MAG: Mrp/NBP35 family ATP-binding protein [Bacteroidota bacterium]
MPLAPKTVIQALRGITDPASGRSIINNDMIRDLYVAGDAVHFTALVADPADDFAKTLGDQAAAAIEDATGTKAIVKVQIDTPMIGLDTVGGGQAPKHRFNGASVIAVASGKGGVGKSTVTVNLAVALAQAGYSVGLLDTDIYGPSIPTMFGVTEEKPRVDSNRKIVPIEREGVKLLSMGFLADPEQAVIWRGPMVSNAIRQFLGDAAWGDLDFLLLDLPPGTGDIQLTIVQTVALTGSVIVSTPQEVALADARRGVAMFENVKVPVLGIVENMAYFTPPDLPEKKYHLFGEGGARRLAEKLDVPFLGEIPIEQTLRESGDAGTPVVSGNRESVSAHAFTDIAEAVALETALLKAQMPAQEQVEIVYR